MCVGAGAYVKIELILVPVLSKKKKVPGSAFLKMAHDGHFESLTAFHRHYLVQSTSLRLYVQ